MQDLPFPQLLETLDLKDSKNVGALIHRLYTELLTARAAAQPLPPPVPSLRARLIDGALRLGYIWALANLTTGTVWGVLHLADMYGLLQH